MTILPGKPGTYALILKAPSPVALKVGALGHQRVERGWHVYVGSAFGPGGLAARVGRHLIRDKSLRWHLDYLRQALPVSRVWLTTRPEKQLECAWAGVLMEMGGRIRIPGFGASDCKCRGHLFHFSQQPSLTTFRTQCAGRFPHPCPIRVFRIPSPSGTGSQA